MTVYIQRQFSGFLAVGETDDPVTVSPSNRAWELQDVYPAAILKVAAGKFSTTTARIAADRAETHTVDLPSDYDATKRLCFLLSSTQDLLIAVVSPDHPASSTVVYAPTDQLAVYSVVETITSISIQCIGGEDASVSYFIFEYPDLTLVDSWRDGYQTLGVVTT